MEKNKQIQLDPQSLTYQRKFQRISRSTLKKQTIIDRMVHHTSGFSKNSKVESFSRSGSICNSPQQQAGSVCFSLPRRKSSSSRCSVNLLGEMGSPLSVSSNTPDFEGFGQISEHNIQECNTNHSRITIETMVHGSSNAQSPFNNPGSPTQTNCSGQSNDSSDHKTSRLDIIKGAYNSRLPDCHRAIELIAAPLRKSSISEYERKWISFCAFLKKKDISIKDITLASVVKFLDHLYFERNLRPGTIAHYRTALTVPLKLRFGIDLHDPAVASLIKAGSISSMES